MNKHFSAHKINDHVYWVGAIDWALSDFHGYSTRGSTYNAYLVLDDKIALIDTVKSPFYNEMMTRIRSVIDPGRIDYIVSNHSEMDHTGSLPMAIRDIAPEKVYASTAGAKNIPDHFSMEKEIIPVKEGQVLSLGNRSLRFMETKMIHWPDSMMAYLEEDSLLFSNDIFGMHWASSERYVDQIDPGVRDYEAAKYFANIFMPYANLVGKLLEKMNTAEIKPTMIAPDHGPIWRLESDIKMIKSNYARWANPIKTLKTVVVYDTMWGSTASMAEAIASGLEVGGVRPRVLPLSLYNRSDIVTEFLDAGGLLVGSSTLNGQVLPRVGDLLTYLRGLKPRHLLAGAFGSYGWHPKAVSQIIEVFGELKLDVIGEVVEVKFVPKLDDLGRCFDYGTTFAAKLKELCGQVG